MDKIQDVQIIKRMSKEISKWNKKMLFWENFEKNLNNVLPKFFLKKVKGEIKKTSDYKKLWEASLEHYKKNPF